MLGPEIKAKHKFNWTTWDSLKETSIRGMASLKATKGMEFWGKHKTLDWLYTTEEPKEGHEELLMLC